MEAFSLLKYWRTNTNAASDANARAATKTLVTAAAVSPYSSDDDDDDDDEGPYFDLQFALPDHDEEKIYKNQINVENETSTETESSSIEEEEEDEEEEEVEVEEVKFTLATNEDDQDDAVSPSERQLFFNEDMISIEEVSEDINSKFPVSLLKSATKFRILLLKLKKSKSGNGILENEVVLPKSKRIQEKHSETGGTGEFCTVKFKVEEVKVPLISLFKRENSNNNKGVNKNDTTAATELDSDEKKLTKEVALQKYLKMVKPLYIRVSKRYLENLKFSAGGGVEITPAVKQGENLNTNQKQQGNSNNNSINLQAGLKVVRKHLGKSRSASSTVTAASPPEKMGSNRRDDSLVQLQDGIQGAILHCKKSFNASRDGESSSSSVLGRSTSDSKLIKEIKD